MMKPKPQKIPTLNGMILVTLVSVTVVFTFMILFVSNFLFKKSFDNAKAENINNEVQISFLLKENFDHMAQFLQFAQKSFTEINFQSRAESGKSVENILMSMLDLNSNIHCAWCIFERGIYDEDKLFIREYIWQNGGIIESSSLNAEKILENPNDAPWYFEPLTTGDIYFTPSEDYKYSHDDEFIYAATISMPISENGEIIGVCGIDILYSDIMGLIYDLHKKQNRVVMLMNRDLTILHASDDKLTNKNLADFEFENIDDMRDAIKQGEVYSTEIFSPISNEKIFQYIHPISVGVGNYHKLVYLQIGTPVSELNAEAYNIIFITILAGFICLLLIAGIVFLNANRIASPIKDLSHRSQQVASGNFNDDIFNISDDKMSSKSEIATLRRAFNEMLHALRNNIQIMERHVKERTMDLKKLNNYIDMLINNTSSIFILMDTDLNILYCSKLYMDFMCINDMSEIVGKSFNYINQKLPDAENYARYEARISRILSGENQVIEDETTTWPNGETRLYRVVHRRIKDDDNKFESVAVIQGDA